MCVRLVLCLNLLFLLMACSVWHDEVLTLSSEQEKDGNALLHTQTLWANSFEVMLLQVIKIEEHEVGVKYLYDRDFNKLPKFPQSFSFGKRIFMIPPGTYDVLISYYSEGRYLQGFMNHKHRELIPYKATIPVNSECAFVSKIENFKNDTSNPEIRLLCRDKRI